MQRQPEITKKQKAMIPKISYGQIVKIQLCYQAT